MSDLQQPAPANATDAAQPSPPTAPSQLTSLPPTTSVATESTLPSTAPTSISTFIPTTSSTWPTTTSPISIWSSTVATTSITTSSLPTSSFSSTTLSTSASSSTSSSSTSSTTSLAATASPTSTTTPSHHSGTQAWLAGVVIGCVAGVALLAGLVFWLLRRRKSQKYHAAGQFDGGGIGPSGPSGGGGIGGSVGGIGGFFGSRHRRLMSQIDMDDAETQRRAIIRKSLISRPSMSASQLDLGAFAGATATASATATATAEYSHGHNLEQGHEYSNQYGSVNSHADTTAEGVSLREDWKEWEAQMERQKALLAQQHPAQHEHEHEHEHEPEVADALLQPRPLDVHHGGTVSPVSPASPNSGANDAHMASVSPVSTVASVMPPVPPRSRLRPVSTDFTSVMAHEQPRDGTSTPPNEPSAAPAPAPATPAAAGLPQRRPTLRNNPHNRHMSMAEPESPSSLYSVDLAGGRQNRAWANYHQDD